MSAGSPASRAPRPTELPDDPDALVVGVGGAMHPVREVFQLRVTSKAAPELIEPPRVECVELTPVPMASVGPGDLAVLAASTGGVLTGLAKVLQPFFNRHRHRHITFVHGQRVVELKTDIASLIDTALTAAIEKPHELDGQWDQVMPDHEGFAAPTDEDAQ